MKKIFAGVLSVAGMMAAQAQTQPHSEPAAPPEPVERVEFPVAQHFNRVMRVIDAARIPDQPSFCILLVGSERQGSKNDFEVTLLRVNTSGAVEKTGVRSTHDEEALHELYKTGIGRAELGVAGIFPVVKCLPDKAVIASQATMSNPRQTFNASGFYGQMMRDISQQVMPGRETLCVLIKTPVNDRVPEGEDLGASVLRVRASGEVENLSEVTPAQADLVQRILNPGLDIREAANIKVRKPVVRCQPESRQGPSAAR